MTPLYHQLLALRAQVDAMLAMVPEEHEELPREECETCSHPPEQRQEISTMGGPPRQLCKLCMTVIPA